MKKIITISLSLFICATALVAKEKETKTAAFKVNIHCDDCRREIEESIPFQKGVKDLFVNMDTKVVTVVYNPAKTDSVEIADAFKRINFEVEE